MQTLLHPIIAGFKAIGVGKTKGYALAKEKKLHIIKMGRKSLLADEELKSLAAELLAEAKRVRDAA